MLILNYRLLVLAFILFLVFGCKKENENNLNDSENPNFPHFEISTLTTSGKFLNTSSYTNNARDIELVGDSILYVHSRGTNSVESFVFSINSDINSATHKSTFSASDFIGTTNQGTRGHGIYIKKDDLSKMWLFNRTEIWEFNFEKAGDLNSVTYSDYLDLSEYVERGHGIYFHPNGKQLYIDDRNKEMIHQFTLSNNWSISDFENYKNLSISNYQQAVRSISFNSEGDKMFLLDTSLKEILAFKLSTPWQINSASFNEKISVNISNPRGFTWNSNGTQAYIMNTDTGTVYEFEN